MLLVAHSQGNLFVNQAYDYAKNQLNGDASSVAVIHIAPASIIINGNYFLADKDQVIGGLASLGKNVPLANTNINRYLPKKYNGGRDFLGHGLVETYLNPKINNFNFNIEITDIDNPQNNHAKVIGTKKDHKDITNPLTFIKASGENTMLKLREPPRKISNGFFTLMLKWDGAGDVDLHVFEPNGSHVYFASKIGTSGALDLDNRRAFGPEHYFASCDKTKLQTGKYQIKIANYKGAKNRKATVWLMNNYGQVLKTKTITLKEETGEKPAFNIFSVNVKKNSKGKYLFNVI